MKIAKLYSFQFKVYLRHGLVYIYGAISILFAIALSFVPIDVRAQSLAFVAISDISVLAILVLGSISLLEREQGMDLVSSSLPKGREKMLASRLASFASMTLLGSFIIGLIAGLPLPVILLTSLLSIPACIISALYGSALAHNTRRTSSLIFLGGFSLAWFIPGALVFLDVNDFTWLSPLWGVFITAKTIFEGKFNNASFLGIIHIAVCLYLAFLFESHSYETRLRRAG